MHHLEWADLSSSLSSILCGHLLAVPLINVFFHEGKFTFISSGRTAALEAGNVYGELSAGAVRNKTQNQNQTVSVEQKKGMTTYFNENLKSQVHVVLLQRQTTPRIHTVTLVFFKSSLLINQKPQCLINSLDKYEAQPSTHLYDLTNPA